MKISSTPPLSVRRPATPAEAPSPPSEEKPFIKMQRPAQLLERLPDGRLRIGNVRDGFGDGQDWQNNPRFKEIIVDPSKIKDCSMVVEPFAPEWAAGHVMGLFEFSEPIEGLGSNQLVVSMEARLREGQTYDMLKGLKHTFQPVFQLCSLGDRVQKSCQHQGHKLVIHRLELNEDQKLTLVKNALEMSLKDHSKEWYHTTRNSCYTTQTDLLNTVIDHPIPRWFVEGLVERPSFALPVNAGLMLSRHHLLEPEKARLIQPDQKLHPELQWHPGKLGQLAARVSQSPLWTPALTLAGAAGGGALGNALSGLPGLAVGAVAGGYGTGLLGDFIKVKYDVAPQPCEPLYPKA